MARLERTQTLRTGLAGEFRVMAKLLLEGFNPAKSYLQDGADLVLDNGLRLEVKTSHRATIPPNSSKKGRRRTYNFNITDRHRKRTQECDFFILWCVDDDTLYVIPSDKVSNTCVIRISNTLAPEISGSISKWAEFREAWSLLKKS